MWDNMNIGKGGEWPVNNKELECFLSVYREGSVAAASEKLYLSSQGVSSTVKKLESELGVQLFARSRHGMEPNEFGKAFYPHAVRILEESDTAVQELRSMLLQNRGYLKLSSAFGILRHLTPDFILKFNQQYPDIHLNYVEYPDLQVEQCIQAGEADIGISPDPDPDLFDRVELFSAKVCFVAREGSRFYGRDSVSVREIGSEPLVLENKNFKIHTMLTDLEDLPVLFNTSGFSLCYKLASQGEANTVTLDFTFDDMKYPTLRMIPFEKDLTWTACLFWRKDHPVTGVMRTFTEYARMW